MKRTAVLILLVAAQPLAAQQRSQPATAQALTLGERVTFRSTILGENRTFDVFVPQVPAPSAGFPTIYTLDGEVSFVHTVSAASFLGMLEEMPHAIVVGIHNTDRNRDLTPTPSKPSSAPPEFKTNGGADRFLDFIERELVPYIDGHYGGRGARVIIGHSLGGLLVVHALSARPALFQGYISLEPSLWWDNRAEPRRLLAFLQQRRDSIVRLVSVERENDFGLRSEAEKLKPALGPRDKFTLIELKGESHISMTYEGRFQALRALFKDGWLR